MPYQVENAGHAPGRGLVATFVAAIVLLAGCSHSIKAGAPMRPVAAEKGDVYIYRTKSEAAKAQPFYTTVDGKVATAITNGTYIVLQLTPGTHRITVSPGAFGFNRGRTVHVKAGERSYYQFDFKLYADDALHFEQTDLLPRSAQHAAADIAKLAGVTPGGNDRRTNFRRTAHADLRDLNSLPNVGDAGRAAYAHWLTEKLPRAFVVASDGTWVATSGLSGMDIPGVSDPGTRALQLCAKRVNVVCQMYAVNSSVVWKPLPARILDKVGKDSTGIDFSMPEDEEDNPTTSMQPVSLPSVEATVIK